jgi:hypothetical protein
MPEYRVAMALFAALSVSACGGSAAQSQPGTNQGGSGAAGSAATMSTLSGSGGAAGIGGTTSGSAGTSTSGGQASAVVTLAPSTVAGCPANWIAVGQYAFPVSNGATDPTNGASVSVHCSIIASGNVFDLNANIASEAAGMNVSDALTLVGQITGSGTQTLQATITLPGGTYASSDCNVLYSQEGEGLFAGLWSGTFLCPDLRNTAQNMTCGTSGQIELQGCSQ